MSDIYGKIRTIGLITMIGCASVADILLFVMGELWWAYFWLGIILLVVGFEIASYIVGRLTISTRWTLFTKRVGWKTYAILGLLATALLGLWVHLSVWGGMFNK